MYTTALFIDDPKCSIESGNGIIRCLESISKFKIFSRSATYDNFFDDVDLIAVPGGVGDADNFEKSLGNNKQAVKKFIQNGGAYLGICMGAYWADKHYFDILDGVRANQYIKSPNTDTRRPHPKAIDITWQGNPDKMYFYDGCTFTGAGSYQTVATYTNGDPMAIIQNRIGLIGCHPESDTNWYDKPYLKRHWHNYKHDTVLLNFVQQLLDNN